MGKNPGSKLGEAKKRNIRLLNEKEFERMLAVLYPDVYLYETNGGIHCKNFFSDRRVAVTLVGSTQPMGRLFPVRNHQLGPQAIHSPCLNSLDKRRKGYLGDKEHKEAVEKQKKIEKTEGTVSLKRGKKEEEKKNVA